MSTIKTIPKFFYGTTVTRFNWSIDFDEGGGELQATLNVGNYSASEYIAEVQRAMRAAGSQDYIVQLDRETGLVEISADDPFDLLALTGSRTATGAWEMLGATAGDKTGSNSYTLENHMGSVYVAQYYPKQYVKEEHSFELEDATVSTTPIGYAQVASFGDGARIPMNLTLITNLTGLKNPGFVENINGEGDFMTFIKYAMGKGRLEFMPDRDNPGEFVKCFLEATAQDRDAKKFKLQNIAVDFYESGLLTFRKVLA